ncbi:hypothetical protein F4803DRAFT_560399 [Xylaria telfairii]|nr:hypothetical protein F4803DRAFT_560399 [Xylaria telfairii]
MDLHYQGDYETLRPNSTPIAAHKPDTYETATPTQNYVAEPFISPTKEPASWKLEIMTLTLSVILFATQISILVWVMDKPYGQVWKAPVSLNAAIAILTTTCKASQLHAVCEAIGQLKWVDFKAAPRRLKHFELYDATSRGPQGAVKFILRVKWGLATIGAFIVVIALAADPFTQQVVEFTIQDVSTPDQGAVFGFSRAYNTSPHHSPLDYSWSTSAASRDVGMQAAILRGTYDIASQEEFQCGGACSWNKTYTSFGFASTCKDVKAAAEATKVCSGESTKFCNYTTPGNVHFSTKFAPTDETTSLVVAVNTTFSDISGFYNGSDTVSPDFLTVAVFQSNRTDLAPDALDTGQENITECVLSLSLYEYSDITANGSQLFYTHKIRKLDGGWPSYLWPGADIDEINTGRDFMFNQSDVGPIDPPFIINGLDWGNMVHFFTSDAFISKLHYGFSFDDDTIGAGAAFSNTDVSSAFTALAKSMTDYLRSLSKGPNVELAYGLRIESVVFVRIRWYWLILPLLQQLAAVIFVVWVIICNKRSHIPGWKSSALAVLAHSVSDDSLLVTNFHGPTAIMERTNKAEVQLQ